MSLALIQESAKEVRRLAIAGSPLAVGDFRLKKLIAPMEQAGAKVPVFAQVAKAIGDLVNGKEADSAAHLLSLSTLLNAILYTQGQTGTQAAFQELEMLSASSSTTQTPARILKPIIQALTTAGSGRFEVVKSAREKGAFNDLRLIGPAIRALDDTYAELADLVAEQILPAYGPGIVPLLKQGLDVKGKKSDGRRLRILHQLDPAGTLDVCKTALEDGSAEVRATAIACLGKHEDCLPLVLEQANSKNKTLRAAALEALAEHDRPEIAGMFAELIKGKALDILAQPFRRIRNRQVLEAMIAEGKRVFDLGLKGDQEQLSRYWEILACFGERTDAETEGFLLGCFNQCEKLAKLRAPGKSIIAGADLIARLASLLYGIGSPKTLEAVLAKRDSVPSTAFGQVLRSALRIWPPDKVYQEFASLLEQNKGAGREKNEILQHTIWASCSGGISDLYYLHGIEPDSSEAQMLRNVVWDPRWLDAAIKTDQQVMACWLARPGHKGAVTYLSKRLDAKNPTQTGLSIQALARCQYPKTTDVFLEVVARKTKSARLFDFDLQMLFQSARFLPVDDLPKLDAFAAGLDEKFVDKFLEALEPLRTANPSK